MLTTRCHSGIGGRFGLLVSLARRVAVATLSVLLVAAPASPQSQSSSTPLPAAPPQAATPPKSSPRPDKNRAQNAFQQGRHAEQSGDWKSAYADYSEAVAYAPANKEFAIQKEHARFQVIKGLVDAADRQEIAGNSSSARTLLLQALQIDPNYDVAQERLKELAPDSAELVTERGRRLAGLPRLNPKPGTWTFNFHGTVRSAYEEIGRQFGVTLAFDGNLPDRSILFRTPPVDYETAVMVLSRQTKTFTRVADEHTLFVTDDTAQNEREYAPEIEKSLLLSAAVTPDEMNETVRMIREMTGISRTQLNTASRTLTVRSTEQNVALAQAILQQIEQPHGELMLEIEILELNRQKALQLGVTPPSGTTVFTLTPSEIQQLQTANNNGTLLSVVDSIFGSIGGLGSSSTASAIPPVIAFGGGKSLFLATVPGASADFSQALSTVRSAQRILLRAQDGKPATFFVGDRYPVSLGLLSSSLSPTSTGVASGSLTSLPTGTPYTVGASPLALALGDFNGDGIQDLVVANSGDHTISILLGEAGGIFGTQTQITIPGITLPAGTPFTTASIPSAVAVGDFDGDGNLDIAVLDSANNDVLILFGDGHGNFAAPTPATAYSTGTAGNPVALIVNDLNADGIPDLTIVNQGNGTAKGSVSILLGNTVRARTNTFSFSAEYPVGFLPKAIAVSDFNGDKRPDLAVTNSADSTVSILLQNTALTTAALGTFLPAVEYPTGTGPAGITVADFNRDGIMDIAVANEGASPGTVSILLGHGGNGIGDGTFPTHTEYATGAGPTGIVATDFTGSGNADLAVTDQTDGNLDILVGNGDGTFNAPLPIATGSGPVAVIAADLIGNNAQDAIVVDKSAAEVTVILNTIQSLSNSSSSQVAYPSAEYLDLGLKVKATPRLHSNNEVTLHLEFDIKSLTGTSVNGIPVLSNRSVEQTVRLRENETCILSGILQTNEANVISGLPFTSTAPGVGDLTGNNTHNLEDTELLIVVTPRALRLPPHDVPPLYAGHGEPSTPASALPPQLPPGVPAPAPPAAPSGTPEPQPGTPPQLPPGAITQPGQPGLQPGGPIMMPRPQP
jgi:type II secretory pathway component GspD/PulD (secretin)